MRAYHTLYSLKNDKRTNNCFIKGTRTEYYLTNGTRAICNGIFYMRTKYDTSITHNKSFSSFVVYSQPQVVYSKHNHLG